MLTHVNSGTHNPPPSLPCHTLFYRSLVFAPQPANPNTVIARFLRVNKIVHHKITPEPISNIQGTGTSGNNKARKHMCLLSSFHGYFMVVCHYFLPLFESCYENIMLLLLANHPCLNWTPTFPPTPTWKYGLPKPYWIRGGNETNNTAEGGITAQINPNKSSHQEGTFVPVPK